ncbi:hypothetical protein EDC96DRAFT_541631 [Choanephora cucurbitarum]|nr:hypothetical protein EDC96DRAFT_541631 [Choanephora cucurbitarum]
MFKLSQHLYCFNLNEELQQNLCSTIAMERHHWQPGQNLELKPKKAEAEPNLKHLPGVGRTKRDGTSKRPEPQHITFLIDSYQKSAAAVLWEVRNALLSAFPEVDSITLSSLDYHLTKHASLTLKKVEKLFKARNADTIMEQRREKVL